MPRSFTPEVREAYYAALKARDGPRCCGCQVSEDEKELVINHRDRNRSNNKLENLDLRCRRCNYFYMITAPVPPIPPRTSTQRVYVSENVVVPGPEAQGRRVVRAMDVTRETPEMRTNREKEPLFRAEVLKRIMGKDGLNLYDAQYGIAEVLDVSPVTTGRWLKKMLSRDGILELGPGARGYQFLFFKEGYAVAGDSPKGKRPEDERT